MLLGTLMFAAALSLLLWHAYTSPLDVAKWKLQAFINPSSLADGFADLATTCRATGYLIAVCRLPLAAVLIPVGAAIFLTGIIEVAFALVVWMVEIKRGKEISE
jgi:hypothetical protein